MEDNLSVLNLTHPNTDTINGMYEIYPRDRQSYDRNISSESYEETLISLEVANLGIVLGTLISLIGILGNVLLISSILTIKKLKKATNIFVASLALCDLLQAFGVQPLYIYTYMYRKWTLGRGVCVYTMYMSNLSILLSILHITVIAFYRYLIVVHRRTSRKFQRKATILIILLLIYLLPLGITVGPSIPKLLEQNRDKYPIAFCTRIMFCEYKRHSVSNVSGFIKKALFLGSAGMFLMYCYVRIYMAVRRSGKLVDETGTGSHDNYTHHRLKREYTLLKTMLVIFLTFITCYLPLSVLNGLDRARDFSHGAYLVTVLLLWLSSSINWIIYGVMNATYCSAYKYLIFCCRTAPPGRASDVNSNNYNALQLSLARRVSKRRVDSAILVGPLMSSK